jgi:hypothetical protein
MFENKNFKTTNQPRVSQNVKPLLNRVSVFMNKNNLSNLTNKLRESKIHNGSTIIGVKDFLNFADNNDIGFTRNDALELAEEF